MMIAAPGQLVSVSYMATDAMMSSMPGEARDYAPNRGQAEQVFLMQPDLVLASPYSSRPVVDLLRRLGIRVEEIPPALTLAGVPEQILATGRAMGREADAEALVAEFRAGLAQASPRGTAASYQPGGHTAAPGSLAEEIMALAGWRNIAPGGVMALERLVMEVPDLLVLPQTWPGTSRAEELLRHPALGAIDARIARSGPDWVCGTPHLLRAVAALSR